MRYFLCLVLSLSILTSCGASLPPSGHGPSAPAGISSTPADALNGALLYVAVQKGFVNVYTFPDSKLVQTLRLAQPTAECVDKGGDVWITNPREKELVEYAHGGTKPIAMITGIADPSSCSVDPTSGDIGVLDYTAGVYVFRGASHQLTKYLRRGLHNVGYDNRGDLFEDGNQYDNHAPIFAMLPRHGTKFGAIELDQKLAYPGPIHWDGSYLAVSDDLAPRIYRFAIADGHGITKGEVNVGGVKGFEQFWLEGGHMAAAAYPNVKIWNYPAGGNPIKTIFHLKDPIGIAVSP